MKLQPAASVIPSLALAALALIATSARADLTWETTSRTQQAEAGKRAYRFVFPFTNAGPGAVKITSVKSSCGCTVAKPNKESFAAGESGEIVATLRPGARKGRVAKSILASYEIAGAPKRTRLSVIVNIPQAWSMEAATPKPQGHDASTPKRARPGAPRQIPNQPVRQSTSPPPQIRQLVWGTHEAREAKEVVFRVVRPDGAPVRLLRLRPSNSLVEATFAPLIQEPEPQPPTEEAPPPTAPDAPSKAPAQTAAATTGQSISPNAWRIRITPKPETAGRPFSAIIRIETDWPGARGAILFARAAPPR